MKIPWFTGNSVKYNNAWFKGTFVHVCVKQLDGSKNVTFVEV
jgi:hypothetical protein